MNELLLSISSVLQIVLINVVLSGDNAIVIAMAVHHLPRRQRRQAMLLGGLFAIALISVLTLAVAHVLLIPGVRFAGALMLIWIACKLLQDETADNDEAQTASGSLRTAVGRIVLADLVMSLDNVLAIAGIGQSSPAQLVLGVVVSSAAILVFSTTIIAILDRFRWLVYVGTAILAATAAQLMWHDLAGLPALVLASDSSARLPDWAGWVLQVIVVCGCLLSNRWLPGKRLAAAQAEFGPVPDVASDGSLSSGSVAILSESHA